MTSSYFRHALVLGLLCAIGPFAIDMYLPALPSIAADLNASTAATQMTIMAFFIGFGLSQLIYGPVSDIVGRKPPVYFGLVVFFFASIGCAFAPSIEWLIALRFIQGIGGAGPLIIPRAIIRDMHTGVEATKLLSLVMLVFSVCPILAPLVGSGLIVPFGWRAVFVAIGIVAALGMILLYTAQEETHPKHARVKAEMRAVMRGYGRLVRHKRFLGLTSIGALGMGSFFCFLASSSFIYINHFGLTPTQYSFGFSINAVGFIAASQFSATLGQRFGMANVIKTAVSIYSVMALVLLGVTLAGADNLYVLATLLFFTFAGLGLVVPATMVLALDDHGPIAGMAAALGGTIQMVLGGVMIVIVSQFFDGTPRPMVIAIAGCAIMAFIIAHTTLRKRERVPGHVEQPGPAL
ncbi:MAG: multidrug effflux MFS transporter [Pseudomonadota bacterium]